MSYPHDIYRAVFDYHKRYMPYPATLDAWQAATDELTNIAARFNSAPFAVDLLSAVYGEFERQQKAHERT